MTDMETIAALRAQNARLKDEIRDLNLGWHSEHCGCSDPFSPTCHYRGEDIEEWEPTP